MQFINVKVADKHGKYYLCRRNQKASEMKYQIISDIHGSVTALERALEFFDRERCDMLCILGDILNYGPRNGLPEGLDPKSVAARLNAMADKVVAVRGNCDSEVDQMLLDFPVLADYALLVDEGKKLFLTHGHIYNNDNRPKGKFDGLLYGHTHLWMLENSGDGVVCNTGSVTFPKGGNPPTFAMYEKGSISILGLDGAVLKSMSL